MQLSLNCLYTRKALCNCEEQTPAWFRAGSLPPCGPGLGLLCRRCRLRARPRTGPAVPAGAERGLVLRGWQRQAGTALGRGAQQRPLWVSRPFLPVRELGPAPAPLARVRERRSSALGPCRPRGAVAAPLRAARCSPQAQPPSPQPLLRRNEGQMRQPGENCSFILFLTVRNKVVLKDFKGILWGGSCCVVWGRLQPELPVPCCAESRPGSARSAVPVFTQNSHPQFLPNSLCHPGFSVFNRARWVFGTRAPSCAPLICWRLSELHRQRQQHPQFSEVFFCAMVTKFACSHYFKFCYLSMLRFYWYYSFNSNIGYSRHCLKAYIFLQFLKRDLA